MKFKGFFKSYWKLEEIYLNWFKDYWFAYLLLCVSIMLPFLLIIYWDDIKAAYKKIKDHKKNKKKELEFEDLG